MAGCSTEGRHRRPLYDRGRGRSRGVAVRSYFVLSRQRRRSWCLALENRSAGRPRNMVQVVAHSGRVPRRKRPMMAADPEYCKKEPPKWDEENLTVLERTAAELDAIDQRVCDANGRGHVHGPFMAMDSNSLRSDHPNVASSKRLTLSLSHASSPEPRRKSACEACERSSLELGRLIPRLQSSSTRVR